MIISIVISNDQSRPINVLLDLRRSLLSFNEWYKYQTCIRITWDTTFICDYFNQHSAIHYFHFVIISIRTVSFTSFRDYFNQHSVIRDVCYWTRVVHYFHQAFIVQLCCSHRLEVQCSCLYVCIWQRMSSINNTSIRTYKKSNIIHDFYHSIFDFCYLSFCKIFFALS